MLQESDVRLTQRLHVVDNERDVDQPGRTRRARDAAPGVANVHVVEVRAERHEHPTVHGVLFRHFHAEGFGEEPLRALLVRDPEVDVADPTDGAHGAASSDQMPLRYREVPPDASPESTSRLRASLAGDKGHPAARGSAPGQPGC